MTIKPQILLVDDDPALRGMLSFSLELAGYSVTEASSRVVAINVLKSQLFQVVLLDMGMPPNEHTPEEGVAVLSWLQQQHIATKVIVLTGQQADDTAYLALKHGAFDFLEKPTTSEALLMSVKRALLFYAQENALKQKEGVQKFQLDASLGEGVKSIRNQAEEKLVRQVLADTEFNVYETARRLGLKRENVYYLIKKYQLQRIENSDDSL
ncbi:response regulator [Thiomicrorhabdus arctica]|uniref:response regulator n=1 Tax=Thiomicrorhabdus arctica TaxID=131540 RepID=UPI00036AB3EE|nr:response regulator [Thiomicrorhabdus arctica]